MRPTEFSECPNEIRATRKHNQPPFSREALRTFFFGARELLRKGVARTNSIGAKCLLSEAFRSFVLDIQRREDYRNIADFSGGENDVSDGVNIDDYNSRLYIAFAIGLWKHWAEAYRVQVSKWESPFAIEEEKERWLRPFETVHVSCWTGKSGHLELWTGDGREVLKTMVAYEYEGALVFV